jgi:hypothetical protein
MLSDDEGAMAAATIVWLPAAGERSNAPLVAPVNPIAVATNV